jgi:3D (Asp-Asp-Asp) domain-containing protein
MQRETDRCLNVNRSLRSTGYWRYFITKEVDGIGLLNALTALLIILPGGFVTESHPQETGEMALPQPKEHTVKGTEPTKAPVKRPKTETYIVTWYTAGVESTGKSTGDPAYGITASGTQAAEGRTAACPSSLPFGTRINIEGVGVRTCEDRGGAIGSGRLDVYVESVSEAIQHGRQSVKVEIITEGKR